MGLFNYVKILIKCPKCGKEIGEFQTKDDYCNSLYMETVELGSVRECHTVCDNCGAWVQLKLKKERIKKLTLDDYDIIATDLGEKNERPS
jgi:ribosomal protein S27AE